MNGANPNGADPNGANANDRDPALLAAGYALGSLTPEELAEYESYLASSADARSQAAGFASAAAALESETPEVEPSADLKARLMAQIAVTPQSARAEATDAVPAQDASSARDTGPAQTGPAQTGPAQTGPARTRPARTGPAHTGPAQERARARWFQRPGVVLAAAAAAAVLFVGGGAIGIAIGNGSSSVQEQATTFAQISAASDAQRATREIAGGGTATLIWSKQLGKSAVVVDDLKQPPSGKTYQLWYISGSTATSAGLLNAGSDANTWQVLDGRLQSGDVIGMTIEPSGGSKAPTTKPIVTITS
jgi:anti-sigma-K factor RskA